MGAKTCPLPEPEDDEPEVEAVLQLLTVDVVLDEVPDPEAVVLLVGDTVDNLETVDEVVGEVEDTVDVLNSSLFAISLFDIALFPDSPLRKFF